MGRITTEILNQIKQNIPHDAIAGKYKWETIPLEDHELLFVEAEKGLGTHESQEILRIIWLLAGKTFPWDTIRTLALAVRATQDPRSKKKNLDQLATKLEEARKTIGNTPQDAPRIKQYAAFYADYFVITAQYYELINDQVNALASYQTAFTSYQKNGFNDYANKIQKIIADLQSRSSQGSHLISLDQLESQRHAFEQQNENLKKECEQRQAEITRLTDEITKHTKTKETLEKSLKDASTQLNLLNTKIPAQQETYNQNIIRIKSSEAALQFLIALKKFTLAPLWVEAVRFSLKKNQMDSFSLQAIERLMLEGSPDAVALLAEIAARSPQPFPVSEASAQVGLARFFYLISEARAMREKDIPGAAQKLVDAWDGILALEGAHA